MHNCLTRPTSWGHFKGTHARIFSNKFGKSLTYSYLCTQYGTELHLDCVFHHRFCHRAGETGVSGRLRCVPSDDGFHVFIVKNGL